MSNPKWPQQPPFPPPQGGAPSAFQPPQQQGGFAATQAMEVPAGGFPGAAQPGAPPQAPWGAAPQGPQPGAFGQAPQQGGFSQQGGAFGQPSQPGAFGQAPQQGGFSQQGGAFGQAPQQGAFGQPAQPGAFGQPSQPGAFGQPSQQGGFSQQGSYGQAPQAWGQAPQTAAPWSSQQGGFPPSSFPQGAQPYGQPQSSTGRGIGMLVVGVGLLVAAVSAKVVLRSSRRSFSSSHTTSSTTRTTASTFGVQPTRRALLPDEQIDAKLDPYIQHCLNRFARQVFDAEGRYFQWVDRAKGPNGRERVVYGIYNVTGEPTECQNALTRAAAMTPPMPAVEGAAQRYLAALTTVLPVVRQAHTYYSNAMNWRADNMAQGQLLHPRLLAAFEGFRTAQRAFSDEVGAQQESATEAFLARTRNDPSQAVEHHLKNDQRMARRVVRMTHRWDVSRGGELTGIDVNALAPAVAEYQTGLDSLRTAAITYPAQAMRVRGLPNYQSRCQLYLTQLQRLTQRLQTGERFSRGDMRLMSMRMGHLVMGSPEAVNRAYNDAVQAYNLLR